MGAPGLVSDAARQGVDPIAKGGFLFCGWVVSCGRLSDARRQGGSAPSRLPTLDRYRIAGNFHKRAAILATVCTSI